MIGGGREGEKEGKERRGEREGGERREGRGGREREGERERREREREGGKTKNIHINTFSHSNDHHCHYCITLS